MTSEERLNLLVAVPLTWAGRRALARAVKAELAALREMRDALMRERHEIDQVLGRALGYPPCYPDVSPADDGAVCTGEHTPLTLADEAAARLRGDAAAPPVPTAIVQVSGATGGSEWHAFADLDEAFRFTRAADRDSTLIRLGGWTWHLRRPAGEESQA